MAESSRLEDLRRRVQQDPSSIAFAQLAEEYRRAAMFQEAVDVCRAGLHVHPTYLSARVTLGRALVELQLFEDAQQELEHVLLSAPENLAAIRGLADAHHRRGALPEALVQYRAALAIAKHDPDLEQTVADLARQVEPKLPSHATDGLSFEQAAKEFLMHAPAPAPAPPPPENTQALATIAALEQLLSAVHVARAERRA
jgi:tetratricopeptide (TPR) repeat protein